MCIKPVCHTCKVTVTMKQGQTVLSSKGIENKYKDNQTKKTCWQTNLQAGRNRGRKKKESMQYDKNYYSLISGVDI